MQEKQKFLNKLNWYHVQIFQTLSENFIREFQDKVNWIYISEHQTLSEDFIREFKDDVNWTYISAYQKLSEDFIREFQNKVKWYDISIYQILSKNFIREFKDRVGWHYIEKYQKLSDDFIKEFNLTTDEDNWLYKDKEFKKQAVVDTGLYECYDDYFIAYKGIKSDRCSNYNFQYQYLPGNTYESHCDCTSNEYSFGLSAWTEHSAKTYCNELIVRVKIRYEDVGFISDTDEKIRCSKFEVLN